MTDIPVERTTPVLAWHSDPDLKASAVERMRQHRQADTFIQGNYVAHDGHSGEGYRGCFHGCLAAEALAREAGMTMSQFISGRSGNTNFHHETQRLFGIPKSLGALLDWTFEAVDSTYAGTFALAATEAIPVGADLSLVESRLILDLLADDDHGARRFTESGGKDGVAVDAVIALFRRRLAGEQITNRQWGAVCDKAYAARGWAARAAAAAAEDDGAACVAGMVEDAITEATDSPIEATVDSVAEYRRWVADRLIHHLSTAPVVPAGAR